MFQQILVPMDGSTASFHALEQALQIAVHDGAVVTALYVIDARVLSEPHVYLPMHDQLRVSDEVVPPSKAASTYQAWAQQVTARARARGESAHVELRTDTVTGIPYQEIATCSSQYDLLVIGIWDTTRTYPGPFLAGTTVQHVVARTHLPILCVQSQLQKLESILVAYDGSREALDAVQLAATWSQAWGLTMIVLTVQQDGDQAQALLQKARARAHPVSPRLVARDGDPAEAILTFTIEHHCDLVALGTNAGRRVRVTPAGGVVDTLLRSSKLPMLLSH